MPAPIIKSSHRMEAAAEGAVSARQSRFAKVYHLAPVERIALAKRGVPAADVARIAKSIGQPKERLMHLLGLPRWDTSPAGKASLDASDQWIAARTSLLLTVPSAIVPEESNLLINPFHADLTRLRLRKVRRWTYDAACARRDSTAQCRTQPSKPTRRSARIHVRRAWAILAG